MSVNYISFSAHSDFLQTSEFIDTLMPPYVILVHGDSNEMGRLKASLTQKYENKNIQVFSPKNGQRVQLKFRAEKIAKTVGKLASQPPETGTRVSGLLVSKDFSHTLLDPSDLNTHTQLITSTVAQKLMIPFQHASFDLLKINLEQMYDQIEETTKHKKSALKIHEKVFLTHFANERYLALEWEADPVNDMIADSVIAIVSQTELNPVKVRPRIPHGPELIFKFLKHQFGNVSFEPDKQEIYITVDGSICIVNLMTKTVECPVAFLRERVETFMGRLEVSLNPIS